MRSLLFVPGDSERKLEKGFSSGADVVIVDLEDSVSLDDKPRARTIAAAVIAAHRASASAKIYVRINDFSTGLGDDDLAAVVPARPDGIMLPKCNSGADVQRLAGLLRVFEAESGWEDGATAILPIVTETAAGVLSAASYAETTHPRLAGLTWGAEDLATAVGARTNRDERGRYTDVFRLARSLTVLGASHAGVAAIDTVFVDFRDMDGLRAECVEAERDGFTGKMAIHPAQVALINEVFTPSEEAVAHARDVVAAFEQAGNPGVLAIGGKMYDRPHLRGAQRLLARARG
ncbi:HpcH/HpaI aldolase/citrate lyase family protein [Oryzicola mucosus]|uniref:CoA ester lyase n=1 Tax=Oryzicola mucosus TaxID=2767425 RepID=A0A8J6U6U7_9HYPH|nr:CoA ester lyase [Oryzicola mucosus]MBD0413802.1 CoA ester lyase [Oryzicola mucosus]